MLEGGSNRAGKAPVHVKMRETEVTLAGKLNSNTCNNIDLAASFETEIARCADNTCRKKPACFLRCLASDVAHSDGGVYGSS